MIPVNPPKRKVIKNPTIQSMGVSKVIDPRHMVPIQLKNFTPVGTPIRKVIKEKKGSNTWPVAKRWCAHTETESAEIAIVAAINPL